VSVPSPIPVDVVGTLDELLARLRERGVERGASIAVACAPGVGIGLEAAGSAWSLSTDDAVAAVAGLEHELQPRWVWWGKETAAVLVGGGLRPARCWDVAAVHRLLYGGWRDEPARVWALLNDLPTDSMPEMGQLDLLGVQGDEGDFEAPVRPDGHLRPEWLSGAWAATGPRLARWAATASAAAAMQQQRIAALDRHQPMLATVRSESAAEMLCVELAHDGLPIDLGRAEEIIASFVGPRAANETEATLHRRARDEAVLQHAPPGWVADLRNPAHVRSLLRGVGVDVADTRAWRLEPFRDAHPLVDALLTWRKAERIETTFGYAWLDANVGRDGRLRGGWSGSDGAAGRMTAQAGLHNMPADLRPAVAAEPGHAFVHADLGQIEPRVLAAVSGDDALARAADDHDMYAPVAARLGVERPVAKVAVLAAMYGQTSGAAGQALRGLETAYPTAMQYLRDADDAGRVGRDLRTSGGRLIRMWSLRELAERDESTDRDERAAMAARGRFARNAVVQGAAAELFKAWAATVRARTTGLGARIVLCLHDELLVHVPVEHADDVARLVEQCLHEAAQRWAPGRRVRFVADASVITRWSEAKP